MPTASQRPATAGVRGADPAQKRVDALQSKSKHNVTSSKSKQNLASASAWTIFDDRATQVRPHRELGLHCSANCVVCSMRTAGGIFIRIVASCGHKGASEIVSCWRSARLRARPAAEYATLASVHAHLQALRRSAHDLSVAGQRAWDREVHGHLATSASQTHMMDARAADWAL